MSHMIWLCMDSSTWLSVEVPGTHPGPAHVPSRLRHTLPSAYKLGFTRTCPPPVLQNLTLGGMSGYCGGRAMSNCHSPAA